MISLKAIKKSYNLNNESVQVLKDINLNLLPGQLTYLLGESGCGKSTLLSIIGGIDHFSDGEYLFNTKSIKNFSEKEWSYFRRKKIGFVFQNFNLISHLTALENIEMSMILEGMSKSERRKHATELLELVGLGDRINHLPNQLSGGKKQIVSIARSLANNPDIILADEPTGALDSKNSEQIMKMLKEVANQGKIVLVVTHSEKFTDYADKIVKMKDGFILDVTNLHNKENNKVNKKTSNENLPLNKGEKINWSTTLKLAIRNIKNKKWRNILTALGASIGIFGIVTIGALGNGVKEKVTSTVNENTENSSISVYKEGTELLSSSMLDKLSNLKDVQAVYSYNPFQTSVEANNKKKVTISADTLVPKTNQAIYGKHYITHGSYPSKNNQISIPERTAEELFGSPKKAIGKQVKIVSQLMSLKDVYQTVETKAVITGTVKNGSIPMLDSVGLSYLLSNQIMNENPQTKEKAMEYTIIPSSISKVDSIIKDVKKMGYTAETEEDSNKEISNYITMASVAVGMLSGISLVVSSIMIGIVLYVNVLERTKEIGTLKALGAFRTDIRRIFVTEGFMIGMLGGIFGVVGSFIVGKLANFVIKEGFKKPSLQLFEFDMYQIIVIIVLSGLLGVVASFIPAFRASKMNPVEALKYE
ncbi:ATP-binding cassette domain-containing protein [Priestia aryabhattai]|uniref:ABC transporter ATP-binding protein/permease n=1 Tax=Priestia aryabhattai TaxID=412384 RepID=UPI001C0B18B0|nr:ABC transporter ATP-binding protein/permease [Priestia aryabhattai]MBU3570048.1 ATP-binding cassette domain-containing protein [Priestia aryabhattai]WDL87844.1 ATP-binding cassette domain-containing protein [Priestia aryabhattai]